MSLCMNEINYLSMLSKLGFRKMNWKLDSKNAIILIIRHRALICNKLFVCLIKIVVDETKTLNIREIFCQYPL